MNMTSEQIIRNIKLSIISDIKLEEPYLSIYNKLISITKGLNIYESDDMYYEHVKLYGHTKNNIYFKYDNLHKRLYIDIDRTITNFECVINGEFNYHYGYMIGDVIGWYIKGCLNILDDIIIDRTYLNEHSRISKKSFKKVGKLDI